MLRTGRNRGLAMSSVIQKELEFREIRADSKASPRYCPENFDLETHVTTPAAPQDLLPWALTALDRPQGRGTGLSVVAGDASHRRYFRLARGREQWILVHAPPATEKNDAFLRVRDLLAGAGVRVPRLYAADLERGYLLLEDLGDRLLLPALDAASVDTRYRQAFDLLLVMAAIPRPPELPAYDRTLLAEELGRFPDWFAQRLLGCELAPEERELVDAAAEALIDSALEQPPVVVHRDFHSRNLMLCEQGELAVIDFQDAVYGPLTYDLVSLLRDCYIRWPAQRVSDWALAYRARLLERGLPAGPDPDRFLRWFDLMGLQRHLKVLGTFARLYLRDGKPGYLRDLPLVIDYVREILARYEGVEPALGALARWFDARLLPQIRRQPWSTAS